MCLLNSTFIISENFENMSGRVTLGNGALIAHSDNDTHVKTPS